MHMYIRLLLKTLLHSYANSTIISEHHKINHEKCVEPKREKCLLGRGLIIKLTSCGPWNAETNGAEGFRPWDWYHLHLSEIYEKVSVLTHYGTCFETSIGGCAA
jgi:hypothetical protein